MFELVYDSNAGAGIICSCLGVEVVYGKLSGINVTKTMVTVLHDPVSKGINKGALPFSYWGTMVQRFRVIYGNSNCSGMYW